jgi:hypothetical protein
VWPIIIGKLLLGKLISLYYIKKNDNDPNIFKDIGEKD